MSTSNKSTATLKKERKAELVSIIGSNEFVSLQKASHEERMRQALESFENTTNAENEMERERARVIALGLRSNSFQQAFQIRKNGKASRNTASNNAVTDAQSIAQSVCAFALTSTATRDSVLRDPAAIRKGCSQLDDKQARSLPKKVTDNKAIELLSLKVSDRERLFESDPVTYHLRNYVYEKLAKPNCQNFRRRVDGWWRAYDMPADGIQVIDEKTGKRLSSDEIEAAREKTRDKTPSETSIANTTVAIESVRACLEGADRIPPAAKLPKKYKALAGFATRIRDAYVPTMNDMNKDMELYREYQAFRNTGK